MKQKERWKNVVHFITASIDCEKDAETNQRRKELNDGMYKWLMDNYQLIPKIKRSVFGKLPNPPKQQ
jgi:hypothetical protein